jgi:hypothetical protein
LNVFPQKSSIGNFISSAAALEVGPEGMCSGLLSKLMPVIKDSLLSFFYPLAFCMGDAAARPSPEVAL